ncbi:DRAP deaminase [Coemansia sp. Benny D115]|nr:DRAP deaminase [Coemansia sp. Benny D115]
MGRSKKHKLSESFVDGSLDNNRRPTKAARAEESKVEALRPEGIYYEESGLQRIHPYFHKFATHAKGRWVGRTIFDVFSKEFRDRSISYYEAAIDQGLIEINGQRVQKDTVVQNSDLVTHYIHRHEPPVTTQPVGVVERLEDGLLIVDKPGSIPVHPTGRYNYNTVIKMLELKSGYDKLYPVNRLDRLTSGLMLVALNADVARRMERDLGAHKIQKEYVCKVRGAFPEGKVVCDQPIRVVAHKLSLNCVDPNEGKPSLTEFELLSTDGEHSIVYCRPKTGRTHQIRVHLQFLGFPIANDPLYCNTEVWGEKMGKGGELPTQESEAAQDSEKKEEEEGDSEQQKDEAGEGGAAKKEKTGLRDAERIDGLWKTLVQRMEDWKTKQELISQITGSADGGSKGCCVTCASPILPDPTEDELCIWLHAWRYSGPGWSYETPLPAWAQEAEQLIDRVKYQPPSIQKSESNENI